MWNFAGHSSVSGTVRLRNSEVAVASCILASSFIAERAIVVARKSRDPGGNRSIAGICKIERRGGNYRRATLSSSPSRSTIIASTILIIAKSVTTTVVLALNNNTRTIARNSIT